MTPIIKDVWYTVSGTDIEYNVYNYANHELLYTGRAYAFPGEDEIHIRLNDYAAPLLHYDIPADVWLYQSGSTSVSGATLDIYLTDITTGNIFGHSGFIEAYEDYEGTTPNRPINGHYAPGMKTFSNYTGGLTYLQLTWKTGTPNTGYTISDCGDWALYYKNNIGGIDSFLVKGKVVRKAEYKGETYTKSRSYGMATTDRLQTTYRKTVTPGWEVNTGWLNTQESKICYNNLLNSNCVYLHDLVNNVVYPVTITNTTGEEKTFDNERKMINYTIELQGDKIITA